MERLGVPAGMDFVIVKLLQLLLDTCTGPKIEVPSNVTVILGQAPLHLDALAITVKESAVLGKLTGPLRLVLFWVKILALPLLAVVSFVLLAPLGCDICSASIFAKTGTAAKLRQSR